MNKFIVGQYYNGSMPGLSRIKIVRRTPKFIIVENTLHKQFRLKIRYTYFGDEYLLDTKVDKNYIDGYTYFA